MRIKYILFLMFISTNIYAENCSSANASIESVADLHLSIAKSLSNLRESSLQLIKVAKKRNNPTDMLYVSKEFKASLKCSSEIMAPFKSSKNKTIAQSSTELSNGYLELSEEIDKAIIDSRAMLDGDLDMSPGTNADRESERQIAFKKKWMRVIEGIRLSSTVKEERFDPKSKKPRYFFLSKQEKKAVMKELHDNFKLPIKVTMML